MPNYNWDKSYDREELFYETYYRLIPPGGRVKEEFSEVFSELH